MDILRARFTLRYSLIVLAVTAGLFAFAWYLLAVKTAGWSFSAGTLTITHNAAVLALLSPLMLAVFFTQLWDIVRPRDILVLTRNGIHDRRLTRGEVLWDQIEHIHLYRKGWQWMLRLDPKAATTRPENLRLGPMPVYAFNRLCARWQKRPELNVGLGGMTVPTEMVLKAVADHYRGEMTRDA